MRDSAIVTIKRIGNDMSQIKWHNQFEPLVTLKGQIKVNLRKKTGFLCEIAL